MTTCANSTAPVSVTPLRSRNRFAHSSSSILPFPRRDRVAVFREFVVQTFVCSDIVLDVAGGKGDLSWILLNKDGIDAVVVDPRPTDHTKISRTARYIWERKDDPEFMQGRERQALTNMGLNPPFGEPKHLQVFVDDDLLGALRREIGLEEKKCQGFESESHWTCSVCGGVGFLLDDRCQLCTDEATPLPQEWSKFWESASARAVALEPCGHHQPEHLVPPSSEGCKIKDSSVALALLKSTSLILGFHADQATEPCIDLALALQVPFAVVPCCVFARVETPSSLHGQNKSSRLGRYNGFVEYLKRKHPAIRTAKLDFGLLGGYAESFKAKNDVLYMLPEDFAKVENVRFF